MKVASLLFHDVYGRDPGESGFSSEAADRYKLSLADFNAQLAGLAAARADAPILASTLTLDGASPGLWRSASALRKPALDYLLTFDDGGASYYTVAADRLEALGWRGHCFISTDFIGRPGFLTASQIRDLDARGHVIGSHTASHPSRFSSCDPDHIRREWAGSRRVLEDLLGHAVTVASVPGGYYSKAVAASAREAGFTVLFNSEPTTGVHSEDGCTVVGRFPIRRGDHPDTSRRLVMPAPWTRSTAWAAWNAKGLVKPVLGPAYVRVADWLLAGKAPSGRTLTRS